MNSDKDLAWYRELLARFLGVNGRAREVAVLRFLIGGDDLDRYVARRSLTDGGFAVAMNRREHNEVKSDN